MPTEVYPGIYVSEEVETWDGKGNKTIISSKVFLELADGWRVTLHVPGGMHEHAGDMEMVVTNRRITGPESAIRVNASWRDMARHLGWLVRRYTVVKEAQGERSDTII